MKKLFVVLAVAAVTLVACKKEEIKFEQAAGDQITFKAVAGPMTKGAELTGTVMPNTYGIYAAATQKNANGLLENPNYFGGTEQLFGTSEATPVATTPWHAGEFWDDDSDPDTPNVYRKTPIYWPIGGVKMDFLAYAMPAADHNAIAASAAAAADWTAYWNNAATDVANKVSFNGVDTYANQVDVLYAVANERTSANSGASNYVPMTFNHAQALLIFNVKRNSLDPLPALQISEIAFYTDARVEAIRAHQVAVAADPLTPALADLADADVTLKTVGTFTVDNSRNNLLANWTYAAGACKKENYKMPNGAHADWAADKDAAYAAIDADAGITDKATAKAAWDTAHPEPAADAKSASNLATVSGFVAYASDIPYAAAYAQLGETLLIPEQEKVNFTMKYTLGGNTYYYTFNDLRGVWEKGKKYIYNIDITLQEIIITETVVDWVPGFDPEGDKSEDVPLS